MIKKIFLAVVLFSIVTGLQAQKKWFNQALKNGRKGVWYVIENPKKKKLDPYKVVQYAVDNDYIIGTVKKEKIKKTTRITYFEFLPRSEYHEIIYSLIQLPDKPQLSELKQRGDAYFFYGVHNTDCAYDKTELMQRVDAYVKYGETYELNYPKWEWKKEVDFCNYVMIRENFPTHYFTMLKNLKWSGNVKNGKLDGYGVAFGRDTWEDERTPCFHDRWVYFKGTFENGFPVGQYTFYWIDNPNVEYTHYPEYVWEGGGDGDRHAISYIAHSLGNSNEVYKHCSSCYKVTPQTFSLSRFEEGKAHFEGDDVDGYIDSTGTGVVSDECYQRYKKINLRPLKWKDRSWRDKHEIKYDGGLFVFDTIHTENDRKEISDILRNKKILWRQYPTDTLSIPLFYIEEYENANHKWSRERLTEIMEDLKAYYNHVQLNPSKELNSILIKECRRNGKVYEYACLTKNPTLLTEKERNVVADSIFSVQSKANSLDTIVEKYLAFFPDGKYRGKDLKPMAARAKELVEREQILNSRPNPEEYEKWVRAYIGNAHDMLERNDENLWTRCFEGDVTKYPFLVEGIGRYRTSGGMFGSTFYCFYGSSLIKWHNEYFEIFERKGVKNIEEAKKYKTLLEGIAIANQGKWKKYDYIDNSEYVAFSRSNFDQKMEEAIRVAREFAVSKPELAPACGKADSIINLERNRIYQGLGLNSSRVEGDHQRWMEKKCEGCRIALFENPSSNRRGYIRLYNDDYIEWYYEKGKIVALGGSNYGGVQEYMSVEEMKSDIIKKCKDNYCK